MMIVMFVSVFKAFWILQETVRFYIDRFDYYGDFVDKSL